MRVLIVSHIFAPANAIGAVRVGKLAKYLVAQGCDVRILAGRTPRLPQNLSLEINPEHVTYADQKAIRRVSIAPLKNLKARYGRGEVQLSSLFKALLKLYTTVLHFPDSEISWLRPALKAGTGLMENWKPDVIYASSPPATSLICARTLAKKFRVPWAAELRDLWIDNPYYNQFTVRRVLERRLERWTLSSASALVTVSDPLAETLWQKYRKPTATVLNGFDSEDFHGLPSPTPDRQAHLTITYTGLIYPGFRDPSPLFEALQRLGPLAQRVRVQFFGRLLPELKALAHRYDVADLVTINPSVAYRDALALQKQSDILLLLLWNSPNERGVFTGKLFEYVGAERPILTIGCDDGVAADLIRSRGLGKVLNDPEAIADALREWIAEKERTGLVAPTPPESKVGLSREDQFYTVIKLLADVVHDGLPPASPRVMVVTSTLDIGGTERHLTRVLPALKARGIDISLYVMQRGGKLEDELVRQGIRVDGPEASPSALLTMLRSTVALTGHIRRERPDVVHFFLPRAYVLGSLAAEIAGHKHRLMSRRSMSNYAASYPLLRHLEGWLHKRTAGLLGNSSAVVKQLVAETGASQDIGLIHNGIELPPPVAPQDRHAMREALNIPQEACVIAIVANMIHYKGHADLLNALGLVRNELPRPWLLLVIGRDDGIGEELKRQAHSLNILANIRWLGERAGVQQLLHGVDIFVLPSHEEGFSNALLEAMGTGIPTVATAVGGNVDAVVDNESGLLVAPHCPEELAGAILRLAQDPALAKRLASAARNRVAQRFSLEQCIDRYERLYRGMHEFGRIPLNELIGDAGALSDHADAAAAMAPVGARE